MAEGGEISATPGSAPDGRWSIEARVTLGRSGIRASRIGVGSSFGIEARDVEWAADQGVNYFYWGAVRRPAFGKGLAAVAARRRDDLVIVLQSFARHASLLALSLEGALRLLRIDRADFLLLGYWDTPPPPRVLDAARRLKEAGKARAVLVSCHARPTLRAYLDDPFYGAVMARYNAAHPGAAEDVFPHLGPRGERPGVVSFNATRWGALLDRRLLPEGEPAPRASDCYRFALTHPDVDTTISGPASRAELEEALCSLARGPMDAEELAWMRRVGLAVRGAAAQRPGYRPTEIYDRVTGVGGDSAPEARGGARRRWG